MVEPQPGQQTKRSGGWGGWGRALFPKTHTNELEQSHACTRMHTHTAVDTHRCRDAQTVLSLRGADSEHIMQTWALCVWR